MDDAPFVGMLHGAGQRQDELRRLPRRDGRTVQMLRQAAAADVLQRQIRAAVLLADLEDLHDARMLHLGDGFGFGAEAGQVLRAGVHARQHHLQRHQPIQAQLPRLIDDPHAAVADHLEDFEAGDVRQGGGGQRRGAGVALT
jgi:hypothetical protein